MGTKCKHLNFGIGEHVQATIVFTFTNGKPPERGIGYHSDITPQGSITVACDDCGFEHTYTLTAKRPKWVQDAWDALMEEQGKYIGVPE